MAIEASEAWVRPDDDAAVLALFERLALKAGRIIMDIRDAGAGFELKADATPVTEADRAAEAVILRGLREALPGLACVAEEEVSAGTVLSIGNEAFLLIDPLDGTREFIERRPDFTVNIALVRGGVPEIGAVYAPARRVLYSGRPGEAAEATVSDSFSIGARRAIKVRKPRPPLTIVASRSHRTPETDRFIAKYPEAETVSVGSSLKFCLVASGLADVYPRFGRTMAWDTAAGDAVLRAAGGRMTRADGRPLVYGRQGIPGEADFANPWFIAAGANWSDYLEIRALEAANPVRGGSRS